MWQLWYSFSYIPWNLKYTINHEIPGENSYICCQNNLQNSIQYNFVAVHNSYHLTFVLDCHLELGQRHTPFIPDKNKTINLRADTLTLNYLNYLLRVLRTEMDLRVPVQQRNRKDRSKIISLYILVKPSVWLFF